MKILIVGWAPFNDNISRMGGIKVYISNIIEKLASRGYEIFYLSSGHLYSPLTDRPFILDQGEIEHGVRLYSLVNSEIIAPAMLIERNFDFLCNTASSLSVLRTFLNTVGPFDVVHLHSMEGLPYAFLPVIKELNPQTKIFYSLHHFHDLCPRVDLFRGEHRYEGGENCLDYDQGAACLDCYHHDPRFLIKQHFKEYLKLRLKKAPKPLRPVLRKLAMMVGGWRKQRQTIMKRAQPCEDDQGAIANYRKRRIVIRQILEKNVDRFLPVSRRTREVYARSGYDPAKFDVEYIGTRVAENPSPLKTKKAGPLTVCYMGYCNKMKGFDYFLRALQHLEPKCAAKVKVVIAGHASGQTHNWARGLRPKFADIVIHASYDRKRQAEFLKDVDLGVVPPQWEDNLPQVAYEFLCAGIPFAATDLGGAQELISEDCSDFILPHGDPTALTRLIARIVENPKILNNYAYVAERVRSLDEDLQQLLVAYSSERPVHAEDLPTPASA